MLLVFFGIPQGIRIRVKGGKVEYRLKKSVLRVQRSWETQRSDLKSMTVQ